MKKLISKNPVQRFKIIKAKQGIKAQQKKTPFEKAGEDFGIKTNKNGNRYFTDYYGLNYFENGDIYSENGRFLRTDSRFRQQYNNRKNAVNNKVKAKTNNSNKITTQEEWNKYFVDNALLHRESEGPANNITTQEDWDEYFIKNAKRHRELEDAEYAKLQKSNNQKSTTKKLQNSTTNNKTNKRPNQLSTNSVKSVPKNQTNVTTPSRVQKRVNTVTSPKFRNVGIQKGWTRNYGNELWNKITDEQKNILKSTGKFTDDSFKDAKSLQTALNNYFIGKNSSRNPDDNTLSQIAVDNKWGDQSQRAFDEALSAAQYQQYSPSFTVTSNYIPYYPNAQMLVAPKISLSTPTYDRSGIRNVLREFNLRPYGYSGAQRKALRMMANNTYDDNDKLLVRQMNLPQTLLERLKISLKKGGLIKV